MKQRDAIQLIREGVPSIPEPSTWIDLGCGNGTFTKALAELLPNGSSILAIDKENQSLSSFSNVTIQFRQADFTKTDSLPMNPDGILIANALHYVNAQQGFLTELKSHLKSTSRILIIEYDTDTSTTWVPYPLSFTTLKKLLTDTGFSANKIGEMNSVFNQNKIYACEAFPL